MRSFSKMTALGAALALVLGAAACSSAETEETEKKSTVSNAEATPGTDAKDKDKADKTADKPDIPNVKTPDNLAGQPAFTDYSKGMGKLVLQSENNPTLNKSEQDIYYAFITCVSAESYGKISTTLAEKLAKGDFEHVLNAPISDSDTAVIEKAVETCTEQFIK